MWLKATDYVYWSSSGNHAVVQYGHELLMQLVLHKPWIVREELHYGLDDEPKVIISFLTGEQYSKMHQH